MIIMGIYLVGLSDSPKRPTKVVGETVKAIQEAQQALRERLRPYEVSGQPGVYAEGRHEKLAASGGTVPYLRPAQEDPRAEACSTDLMRQIRDLRKYCERENIPVPTELMDAELTQRRMCDLLANGF